MKNITSLIEYLKNMPPADTVEDIYQAAIILRLLENGGRTTKDDLIHTLMRNNNTFRFYYQRVLDRATELDLLNQDIFTYNAKDETYFLNLSLQDAYLVETATKLCRSHLLDWQARQDRITTPDWRSPVPKLVRDRIPEIIAQDGRQPITQTVVGDALQERLLEKLAEEHVELLENTNVEEIADMIEVLLALGRTLGHDEAAVLAQVREKRAKRGGFEHGVYLKGVIPAPETTS